MHSYPLCHVVWFNVSLMAIQSVSCCPVHVYISSGVSGRAGSLIGPKRYIAPSISVISHTPRFYILRVDQANVLLCTYTHMYYIHTHVHVCVCVLYICVCRAVAFCNNISEDSLLIVHLICKMTQIKSRNSYVHHTYIQAIWWKVEWSRNGTGNDDITCAHRLL